MTKEHQISFSCNWVIEKVIKKTTKIYSSYLIIFASQIIPFLFDILFYFIIWFTNNNRQYFYCNTRSAIRHLVDKIVLFFRSDHFINTMRAVGLMLSHMVSTVISPWSDLRRHYPDDTLYFLYEYIFA